MPRCSKVRYANQWSAECALRAIRFEGQARKRKVPTGSYWCGEVDPGT